MAESKKTEAAGSEAGSAEERTYSLDRLQREADAFLGVPSHVAAGAFYGVDKEELTVDEAKALVAEFGKRKVD